MTRPRMLLTLFLLPVVLTTALAEEPVVQFDVPALQPVRELVEAGPSLEESQKLLEVVIPVSSRITGDDRFEMEEFQFEVFWNRNVYPLVDFGPRTITGSPIEGTMQIEEREDRSGNFGINLNARFNELVGGAAQAGVEEKTGRTVRYSEIPEQDVVIASGSIQRGTGAYFRFRPARTTTLEGSRELMLVFQVPAEWRGGLIQVDCRARGKRKRFPGFSEPWERRQSFVIPVYQAGDEEARRRATEYVRSERSLRDSWFEEVLSHPRTARQVGIRNLDLLVRSSTNEELRSLHRALPRAVVQQSKKYLAAKQELVALGKSERH